jgi:hypothetical protein
MKEFSDEAGAGWLAGAQEENTPRHHGRWFLIFHPAGDEQQVYAMPEVRWQTRATAERTLRTMSDFELRRRLYIALERSRREDGVSPITGDTERTLRDRTSAGAG